MSVILNEIVLSVLPISELRGGIPYAIAFGLHPILAYLFGVLGNLLIIPLVFFFLDNLHKYFLKIKIYSKIFNEYINKNRKKLEKHIGSGTEFWALFLIVAIPLPFTGAYTGSILAWFFGLKRRKSYLAIVLGILIAGILVSLASLGLFR